MAENINLMKVCASSELKENKSVTIYFEDIDIEAAVFRISGRLYAFNNECPHNHERKINKGFIAKDSVSCPMHGWTFSLETGKNTKEGGSLDKYEVFERDGVIYIEKPQPKKPKWME